jgi:hypothetical protein
MKDPVFISEDNFYYVLPEVEYNTNIQYVFPSKYGNFDLPHGLGVVYDFENVEKITTFPPPNLTLNPDHFNTKTPLYFMNMPYNGITIHIKDTSKDVKCKAVIFSDSNIEEILEVPPYKYVGGKIEHLSSTLFDIENVTYNTIPEVKVDSTVECTFLPSYDYDNFFLPSSLDLVYDFENVEKLISYPKPGIIYVPDKFTEDYPLYQMGMKCQGIIVYPKDMSKVVKCKAVIYAK